MKYIKYKNYSNTFVFDTKVSGKTIAIFGGIHGNETSGVKAINKIVNTFDSGEIRLKKGKLILALGNEKAIEINKRDYKYNLNRLFKKEYFESDSKDYEIQRVKELRDILEESDFLLDIHSVSSKSEAFAFVEDNKLEKDLVKYLGVKKTIVGWSKHTGDGVIGGDSDSYMHSIGKNAITLESGNHNAPYSNQLAYDSIMSVLSYHGMVNKELLNTNIVYYDMVGVEVTKTGNFQFEKGINNFMNIKKDVCIGSDSDEKMYSKVDFTILLPNYENLKPGEEIFYYGQRNRRKKSSEL